MRNPYEVIPTMNNNYMPMDITELVFAGFNSRVVAMSRETGEVAWTWKSPKGMSQYVAVMLDCDILIVSISGYMFGLDPLTGQTIWHNPLKGTGIGTPSLCSIRANSGSAAAAAMIAQQNHGG